MSLKPEIEGWVLALKAHDSRDYDRAIELFQSIASSSKLWLNLGLVHTTKGNHGKALVAYDMSRQLDPYMAASTFQCGVSHFHLGEYEKAKKEFNDAYKLMRGNSIIDYEQLGLDFRLFSCEVLCNIGLCLIRMGNEPEGMWDLAEAKKQKQTLEHKVIDRAFEDHGKGHSIFAIPPGILYRPSPIKIRNLQQKNYLGQHKVVAGKGPRDTYIRPSTSDNSENPMTMETLAPFPSGSEKGMKSSPPSTAPSKNSPSSSRIRSPKTSLSDFPTAGIVGPGGSSNGARSKSVPRTDASRSAPTSKAGSRSNSRSRPSPSSRQSTLPSPQPVVPPLPFSGGLNLHGNKIGPSKSNPSTPNSSSANLPATYSSIYTHDTANHHPRKPKRRASEDSASGLYEVESLSSTVSSSSSTSPSILRKVSTSTSTSSRSTLSSGSARTSASGSISFSLPRPKTTVGRIGEEEEVLSDKADEGPGSIPVKPRGSLDTSRPMMESWGRKESKQSLRRFGEGVGNAVGRKSSGSEDGNPRPNLNRDGSIKQTPFKYSSDTMTPEHIKNKHHILFM